MSVRAGFRAIFRQPALVLAEIAWRWAFGAAAWLLIVLSIRRVLAGIDISEAEFLISRRSDVFLIADACARILYQALPALARMAAILVPALAAIWVAAATVGRAATLKALIECHPERASGASESEDPCTARSQTAAHTHFGPLVFLNFLRAAFTLATVAAFFGILILAGTLFPAQAAHPAAAGAIWGIVAALVVFFWGVVNWFLSLAPIWIVRDHRGALFAMSESVALFRRLPSPYVGAAASFAFLRALALVAALVLAVIATSATGSPRIAVVVAITIALLYFAVSDFLFIARLAAFLALDESRQSLSTVVPAGPEPQLIGH